MQQEFRNSNASDDPLYNIGVVSRMTGISVATLRAWERRYGFPSSGRTAGGHRLYSEKDMVRLRWVKGQIDQGMQTAQAIQVLRHRGTPEGVNRDRLGQQPVSPTAVLPAARSQLLTLPKADTPSVEAVEVAPGSDAVLGHYAQDLADALVQYDVNAA